ncbi:Uncharacterised protein [Plesiomonas shigelloides]|nr:Uncharacterised protein [Plesiomonas shigelloides]
MILQLYQSLLCQNSQLQPNQLTGKKTGVHSPTPQTLQRERSPTMFKNGKNTHLQ